MENESTEDFAKEEPPAQSPEEPVQPVSQPLGVDAYQSIIDQQNATINALMAQNQALNGQIAQMVHSGAQITQQPAQQSAAQPVQPAQTFNPQPLSEGDDWSLESLGKEIGKRD